MTNKDGLEPKVAGYARVGNKEQLMSEQDRRYMKEWTEICQAYCDKIGAELLFVNQGDFGCSLPSGELQHIYADELEVILANEQPFSQNEESTGPEMRMF